MKVVAFYLLAILAFANGSHLRTAGSGPAVDTIRHGRHSSEKATALRRKAVMDRLQERRALVETENDMGDLNFASKYLHADIGFVREDYGVAYTLLNTSLADTSVGGAPVSVVCSISAASGNPEMVLYSDRNEERLCSTWKSEANETCAVIVHAGDTLKVEVHTFYSEGNATGVSLQCNRNVLVPERVGETVNVSLTANEDQVFVYEVQSRSTLMCVVEAEEEELYSAVDVEISLPNGVECKPDSFVLACSVNTGFHSGYAYVRMGSSTDEAPHYLTCYQSPTEKDLPLGESVPLLSRELMAFEFDNPETPSRLHCLVTTSSPLASVTLFMQYYDRYTTCATGANEVCKLDILLSNMPVTVNAISTSADAVLECNQTILEPSEPLEAGVLTPISVPKDKPLLLQFNSDRPASEVYCQLNEEVDYSLAMTLVAQAGEAVALEVYSSDGRVETDDPWLGANGTTWMVLLEGRSGTLDDDVEADIFCGYKTFTPLLAGVRSESFSAPAYPSEEWFILEVPSGDSPSSITCTLNGFPSDVSLYINKVEELVAEAELAGVGCFENLEEGSEVSCSFEVDEPFRQVLLEVKNWDRDIAVSDLTVVCEVESLQEAVVARTVSDPDGGLFN